MFALLVLIRNDRTASGQERRSDSLLMHDLHTVRLHLQPESLARMESALKQECGFMSPLVL